MRSHPTLVLAAALVLTAVTSVGGRSISAQGQTPLFRAGVEVVQLDVSVFDKDRQTVRGLTADDFTILEDGKPQKMVAFDAIDMPDVVTPISGWMRDVTPDVTTNNLDNKRLFIILLDDATIGKDPWILRAARQVGHRVVDLLGPTDLATVVLPRDNRATQDFTSDHAKLGAAIDTFSLGFYSMPGDPCNNAVAKGWYEYAVVKTVAQVADYLIAVAQKRKTIVYIGNGFTVSPGEISPGRGGCSALIDSIKKQNFEEMEQVFRRAQQANVNVYSFDVNGLSGGGPNNFIQMVAENTGGRATINTNDFEPGIQQMFRENSSYYILGYTPANQKADGTFRRLEVKVNRPGLEARTRKNYYAPLPESAKAAPVPGTPMVSAVSGILPNADITLEVATAPFAVPDSKNAAVAVALALNRSAHDLPRTDDVDVGVRAFTPEGKPQGSTKESGHFLLRAGADERVRYEVLSQLDLPPGRYEFRIAAHSASLGKEGSVYADVIVPDFAKEPVSLSGVIVNAIPSLPVAPAGALTTLVPIVPTSLRGFDRGTRVATFMRVYEGNKTPLAPVTLSIRIVNEQNAPMADETRTVAANQFDAKTRAADDRFDVPLTHFPLGSYLLTFQATLGKTTARRDVRFTVR